MPALSDKAKLAGNDLMNFAAFLRERWRENDWMWGRMDAVVTLVDVLVEPSRLDKLVRAMPRTANRLERAHGLVPPSRRGAGRRRDDRAMAGRS